MARDHKIAGITDAAVVEATGEPWSYWITLLDEQVGISGDHRERVATLASAGIESGWWQQQLAVGYERERGLREVGETADSGYQVGVQRTLSVGRNDLWEMVTSGPGLEALLDVESLLIEPGASYETADGTTGEIRTVSDAERLRLTWQPAGRTTPTTLQLTLTCPRNDETRTTLRIHHEKLEDSSEREAMRQRWRDRLGLIEDVVGADI